MDVRIETKEPLTVAFVRHIGPYDQCGSAWEKLCNWAGPKGLFGPDTKMMGISYDDPKVTPEEKIRYDACMTIGNSDFEGQGEIGVQEIAGGRYAIVTHKGPYERLAETYAYLYGQWLEQSQHELRDLPPLEVYLNNPGETPPEELLTEVCVPIK